MVYIQVTCWIYKSPNSNLDIILYHLFTIQQTKWILISLSWLMGYEQT